MYANGQTAAGVTVPDTKLARTRAMTAVGSPAEIPDALARYSQARLAAGIRHVTRSEQETAAYLAHAARL